MICIDTREQKSEYISGRLSDSGVESIITCLTHGMDYLIVGSMDSIGVQRKDFTEVATQMQAIREDIIPALMDLTENPVLLVEETFQIDGDGMMWRKEGNFLKPAGISARQYYNFLQSIRHMGCEVVTTRNLDHSIWWMYSIHSYIHEAHYPHQKKKYGADMQAMGAICCFNGLGKTLARKVLQQFSIRELAAMKMNERGRILTFNQNVNFEKVLDATIKPE